MKRIFVIILSSLAVIVGLVFVWRNHVHREAESVQQPVKRRLTKEEAYRAEIERFSHVITEASDEELFLMLRTAMYNGCVPLHMIDPYFDLHYAVGSWYRTGLIYRRLSERKDLLSQIYSNLERLDDYVLSQHAVITKEWVRAMQDTIKRTLAPDAALYDSIYWRSELREKYFGTPLMDEYW